MRFGKQWLIGLLLIPFAFGSESLFFDALRRGDQAQMNQLLARQPSLIRAVATDGRGPLHHAVTYRAAPLVERLLALGADAGARDTRGNSVLHALVRFWPDAETADRLLQAGADPNQRDRSGNTPLFLQMRLNQRAPDLTAALLKGGADPNLATRDGWVPLHFAMQQAMAGAVSLLLQHGADPNHANAAGQRPIHMFGPRGPGGGVDLRDDYLVALTHLLKKGADANLKNVFRGSYAGFAHDRRRLALLLDHGTVIKNSDGVGSVGLHDLDTVELIEVLLDRGAVRDERNAGGLNRLAAAITAGRDPVLVRFLINRDFEGAALDHAGNNSLHHLCTSPYPPDTALNLANLLLPGTPPDHPNTAGATPLALAVRHGRNNLVRPMLAGELGRRFDTVTLTDLLAESRAPAAAEALIAGGASPHGTLGRHPSPLQSALSNGRIAVAHYLMGLGAALDPLELAALQRKPLPQLFRASATMARAGDDYLLKRRAQTLGHQPFDPALSRPLAEEVGLAPLILIPFWLDKLTDPDPNWRYHAVQQLEAYSGDSFGSVPQIPMDEATLARWRAWYDRVLPQLETLTPNLDGDIGLEVDITFTIQTVSAGSAAAQAGLKAGMQVLTVNGRDTRRMTPHEFERYHRRGPVGTSVSLTIVDQRGKQRDVSLQRAEVR